MAYSYNEYTWDDGTHDGNFTIAFDSTAVNPPGYLSQDHVKLYVAGVDKTTDLTFVDSTHVYFDPLVVLPVDGDIVRIQRESQVLSPYVDWESGAIVSESNLDDNTLQMLYVAQEAADQGEIDISDAETAQAAAEAAQALAEAAQALAETAQAAAELAETNAETAEVNAETAETGAETAETNAETAETAAVVAQNKAEDWAEEVEDTEVETGKYSALHWAAKSEIAAGTALQNIIEDLSPELSNQLDANGNVIKDVGFKDTYFITQNLGTISSSTSLLYNSGEIISMTMGASLTLTFSNPPTTTRTGIMILEITNGGAYTITWPTSVVWDGGTAPSLQASGVDIITFVTRDAGTTWRAVRGWKEA